jgi:hypothetical protein
MTEPENSKVAKYNHDFNGLANDTIDGWVRDWLADLIRSNNQTSNTRLLILGIGKTTRLLRTRIDFCSVDEYQRYMISKAYENSTNRLILLDNEVSFKFYI